MKGIIKDLFEMLASDKLYLRVKFLLYQKRLLKLRKPKTLNEKIQWLKLYDRTELHTTCADKYAVREFVNNKIGEKYLIPLIFETSDYKDVNRSLLPDYPVIIKASHDSGSYLIVWDKNNFSEQKFYSIAKQWFDRNFYKITREWQYKNIEPKIIIEKLLCDEYKNIPNDIKFHCIDGEVVAIQYDIDRGKETHARNWYDKNWNRVPFKWCSVKNGKKTEPTIDKIEKPSNLDELVGIAEKLSNDFIYCRVDLYTINNEIYFGEITFHHDSGFMPIEPYEWDLKLGSLIDLSKLKK